MLEEKATFRTGIRSIKMDKAAMYKGEIEKMAKRRLFRVDDHEEYPLFLDVKKPWYRRKKSLRGIGANLARGYKESDLKKSIKSGDAKGFLEKAKNDGSIEASFVKLRPRPLLFNKKKFDEKAKDPQILNKVLVPEGSPLESTVRLLGLASRKDK